MSRQIVKGSADQSTVIRIVDATTGAPETGVTSATAGLDLGYRREGAARVALTESDLTALTDAHADGGILHIANGLYRVDLPDAAVATGADGVLVEGTATDMVVIPAYHELVDGKAPAGMEDVATAKLDALLASMVTGTAQTGTLSATQMSTDLTAADNRYNGRALVFLTGNLAGEGTRIFDYANASGLITMAELSGSPANGDTFVIL